MENSSSKTIEVGGVRFKSAEVVEVTIKRNGRKIHIEKSENKDQKAGFKCPQPESEGE